MSVIMKVAQEPSRLSHLHHRHPCTAPLITNSVLGPQGPLALKGQEDTVDEREPGATFFSTFFGDLWELINK